jgi:hypothetical protein
MAIPHKIHWNGKDLPDALRDLPPGDYVLESVDDPPALSLDQDLGIEAAIGSLDAGKARTLEQVQQTIGAILRR